MRDIEDYAEKYEVPGFERYKVFYRKKKIIEIVEKYHPKDILEIGCGSDPLFRYIRGASFTVVEPAQRFFENALLCAEGDNRISCLHGFFEDVVGELSNSYEMIICSSLLHEVEDPNRLLTCILQVCNENTIIHFNVPNANSMHRMLGKEIGILKDIHDMSKNNTDFQQTNVFDKSGLNRVLDRNGFEVIEWGGYFIKPFSHKQMYSMVEDRIIDKNVLDGLYKLGECMPDISSEIYANCKIRR